MCYKHKILKARNKQKQQKHNTIIHSMETVLRVPGESSGVNWRIV